VRSEKSESSVNATCGARCALKRSGVAGYVGVYGTEQAARFFIVHAAQVSHRSGCRHHIPPFATVIYSSGMSPAREVVKAARGYRLLIANNVEGRNREQEAVSR